MFSEGNLPYLWRREVWLLEHSYCLNDRSLHEACLFFLPLLLSCHPLACLLLPSTIHPLARNFDYFYRDRLLWKTIGSWALQFSTLVVVREAQHSCTAEIWSRRWYRFHFPLASGPCIAQSCSWSCDSKRVCEADIPCSSASYFWGKACRETLRNLIQDPFYISAWPYNYRNACSSRMTKTSKLLKWAKLRRRLHQKVCPWTCNLPLWFEAGWGSSRKKVKQLRSVRGPRRPLH